MNFVLYCIVPDCESTNQSNTLFEIPKNNPLLLEKWKKQFPLLVSMELRTVFICQDHFRSQQMVLNQDLNLDLMPESVPTIFSYKELIIKENMCRFCFSSLPGDEIFSITKEVKKSFKNLMQTELSETPGLPMNSCLKCLEELKRSEILKTRIEKVQEKLLKMLDSKDLNIKSEFDDLQNLEIPEIKMEFEAEYAASDEEFEDDLMSRKRKKLRSDSKKNKYEFIIFSFPINNHLTFKGFHISRRNERFRPTKPTGRKCEEVR